MQKKSRSNNDSIAQDLDLQWFRYVGSLLSTSRPFCIAMVEKDYVHQVEFRDVTQGRIDGKQVSLEGLIEGTNEKNFQKNKGGEGCMHGLYPVSEFSIPKEIRIKTYDKYGIKYDENGIAI